MDPLVVLKSTPEEWTIRVAAAQQIAKDEAPKEKPGTVHGVEEIV